MQVSVTRNVEYGSPDEYGLFSYEYDDNIYEFTEDSIVIRVWGDNQMQSDAYIKGICVDGQWSPLNIADLSLPITNSVIRYLRDIGKTNINWFNGYNYELVGDDTNIPRATLWRSNLPTLKSFGTQALVILVLPAILLATLVRKWLTGAGRMSDESSENLANSDQIATEVERSLIRDTQINSEIAVGANHSNNPLSIVMEASYKKGDLTLACYGDGRTTIIRLDGGIIHVGQEHTVVWEKSKDLVLLAGAFVHLASTESSTGRPPVDNVRFILRIDTGALSATMTMYSLMAKESPWSDLFSACMDVLSTYAMEHQS